MEKKIQRNKSGGLYKKNGKISGGLLLLYAFLQYTPHLNFISCLKQLWLNAIIFKYCNSSKI